MWFSKHNKKGYKKGRIIGLEKLNFLSKRKLESGELPMEFVVK